MARRWRIRTLMILVALVAAGLGGLRMLVDYRVHRAEELAARERLLAEKAMYQANLALAQQQLATSRAAATAIVTAPTEQDQTGLKRDRVKGSINHGRGKDEWERIAGKVEVLDANTLVFEDGARIMLDLVAPGLDQQGSIDGVLYPCGQEAKDYLQKLIGNRIVVCTLIDKDEVLSAYVGNTNIEHAMVINGWALAGHSSLHTAEIIARENKRGLWRGEFVNPEEWREGKRLPAEKP